MICPPQSVQITSTPSFLSALATRFPPEITGPVASLPLSLLFAFAIRSSHYYGFRLLYRPLWERSLPASHHQESNQLRRNHFRRCASGLPPRALRWLRL